MRITYQSVEPLAQSISDEVQVLASVIRSIQESNEPGSEFSYSLDELEMAVTRDRNRKARELLREWSEHGDEDEQRDTFETLKQALNNDRTSYRRVFK